VAAKADTSKILKQKLTASIIKDKELQQSDKISQFPSNLGLSKIDCTIDEFCLKVFSFAWFSLFFYFVVLFCLNEFSKDCLPL